MCAELTEDYGFSFDYSLISFSMLKYDRYTSLSSEQRSAVRSYLVFQRDHPDNESERDTY